MANRKMTLMKTKLVQLVPTPSWSRAKRLGVSAFLMLSWSNAFALGLGSLAISSNLDQPLRGEIELRVAQGDDLSTLTAVIASREDFESLGIDYPSYLKDFDVIFDDLKGQSLLRVTSNDVIIKEPFIHFLVRVEWAGGSFLREYTALIDPPVYAAESPVSIAEPKEVGTDQTYPSPSENVVEVEASQTAQKVESAPTVEAPITEDDFYADDSADTPGEPNLEYASAAQPTDATYGPVESGESLSVIAQDLQRQFPDLSIYQIMKVLFDENVESFIGENINGLIQGSILKIGDLNAIRSVDIAESKAFYSRQIADWNPELLLPAGSESLNVGQDNYNFQDDGIIASEPDYSTDYDAQDNFQVGASTESNDYVSSDQGESREGEVLALRQEITSLESSLTSSALENQELSERISLLEGQLADMNRLAQLSIEDSDLALIESTLSEQNEVSLDDSSLEADSAASYSIEDLDDGLGDNSAIDEFLTSDNDSAEDIADQANAAIDELVDDGASIDEFLIDDEELLDDVQSLDVEGDIDSAVADVSDNSNTATPLDDDTSATSGTTAESFLETIQLSLFEGGLWKILAGLGALLVAGAGLLFLRRRRADEEFEISMLSIESNSHSVGHSESTEESSSMSASHTASHASEAANVDKETSFLTVYSDSDAVVQADEVDPVAEADVYIAYGRDEQAEEVLLDGVISHPDRIDIKQKLLKLYHKGQNIEGFERMAEEIYSQRAALTGDVWQQICEMGKEIAPSNPLFELSGDDLSTVLEVDSELLLEGNDVSEVPLTDNGGDVDENALDFNSRSPGSDVSNIGNDGELDVSAADQGAASKVENASELVVESLTDDESIQLIDFDDGRSEISELDDVEIDALEFGDEVPDSMDLSGKESSTDDEVDIPEISLDDSVDESLNDDEFLDFNVDDSTGLNSTSDSVDQNSESRVDQVQELSDLEIDDDYDEARTQYELAKVFVDLGDEDGARKILLEIVADSKNSSDVLDDAKALLESIDS
jgi:pilus assembly protein FimV